jgi:hypothetical protein
MKTWFKEHTGGLLFLFIAATGLVEPLVPNTAKILYTLYLATFGFLYLPEIKAWLRQHRCEKTWLTLLASFAGFGLLLIVVWHFLPNPHHLTPDYANIDELLFNYALLPVFCILIGLHVTQPTFERAMLLFGACTALFGCFLLYAYFDITPFFRAPVAFIENVLQCRFTNCESRLGWVNVFLKNYSFFPAVGALVLFPFVRKFRGMRKAGVLLLVMLNTLFLLLTINKGTLTGFALVMVVLFFDSIRSVSWKKKGIGGGIFLASCALLIVLLPHHIKARFAEMATEIQLFFTTGHDTGSASIRLTIWKTLLAHADEFWLFGAGPLYATGKLWIYFADAGYQHYIDSGFIYHSQYLTYFHHFGILGLLFLPTALGYPIYIMIRHRQLSLTLIGIIILFLVALIEDRYLGNAKTATLLFFIYFSFFQREKWRRIETTKK